jgi:transposase InsO family protein
VLHRRVELAQYRAIRYTERLAEADAVASVGSKGDSYDNAMAEALNSLFKAECIRNPVLRGSGWRDIHDVELAVATWTEWYNHAAFTARSATSHPPSTRPPTGQTP